MAQNFRQKVIHRLAPTFSLLCISFFLSPTTFASEGSFSVEPLFTDIRIDGEDEQSFFLEVGNTTNDPVVFRLSFVDFGSLDESGGIAFLGQGSDLQKRYGLASWLSAEKDVMTVFPGATEKVRISVMNRDSLSPGGHYGAVLFRAEKEGSGMEIAASSVSVSSNFTALVFVRKTGGEIRQLDYRDAVIRTDMLGVPDKVSERFQNSGNVHVTPRGIVSVEDPFGRIVRKGILNEESGIILPESYRVYPIPLTTLAKAIIPGFYTVSATYRYDGEDAFTPVAAKRFFAWGILFVWIFSAWFLFFGWKKIFQGKRNKAL